MNKIVEKAMAINKFETELPVLEVGDIVELGKVWDGEGETPTESYSYLLTDEGEDGDSNIDVCINYEFEILEQKEEDLDTVVKITNIELV